MSDLSIIHELLIEEYAVSRHIWWHDANSGKLVNDVVYYLLLIQRTAECLQSGDEDCWRELVTYCLERSMSYLLIAAIGKYLSEHSKLNPLPMIDLSLPPVRNVQDNLLPLFDETERVIYDGGVEQPEPDRRMAFRHDHQWSSYVWRTKDDHPTPEVMGTTSKSIHWLF